MIKMSDGSVSCAAVHCEGLGGGEDGGDPEEEAGPGGEGFRLHKQWKENIPDQRHQSSDGALKSLRMSVSTETQTLSLNCNKG